MTRPVYFVGTIGLDTASAVFCEVDECLGGHVRQVPDGEVAGRRQWVAYQLPVLRSYGFLRPQPPNRFVPLELADAFEAADVRFSDRIGFGHGVHQCVGNNLARLEIASLFRELIPRVRRFHVGKRRRALVNLLRIYASLEVTIDPARLTDDNVIPSSLGRKDGHGALRPKTIGPASEPPTSRWAWARRAL